MNSKKRKGVSGWPAGLLGMLALLAAGAVGAGGQPAKAKVSIVGYINESSGCQEKTIQYLRSFAAKHPKDVRLEIVDFGAEAGHARWQADGYSCETIVINRGNQFRVGSGKAARIVVFKMPEGMRWTFEDLGAVLAQEMASPGSSALSDAEAAKIARRSPVAWQKANWHGQTIGEVAVGGQTVFRFQGSLAGKTAAQRAETAATRLKRLYAAGLTSEEIQMERRAMGGGLVAVIGARGQDLAVVTQREADLVKKPASQAAMFWAFNLREGLRLLGR